MSGSVPDLEFDFFPRHLDDSRSEFDADGVRTIGSDCSNKNKHNYRSQYLHSPAAAALTFLLGELMQQARFPDAHVSDYDVLEYVRILR